MAIVNVYTCKPDVLQNRRTPELAEALSERLRRPVTINVLPEAQAISKYVRVSPTKARRVINTIKGKYVDEALAILRYTPNRAARYLEKVLKSAAANASEGWGAMPNELRVSRFIADAGPTLKRIQPRAQGRAYRIVKRTSHLTAAVQEAGERPRGRQRGRQAQVRRAE
ncbi:MAG: 50S ribosomal protein L22 [Armatimonadetes bacterium]|nr:50S ribosomal protein L22 [Armatimonadota bacterium]